MMAYGTGWVHSFMALMPLMAGMLFLLLFLCLFPNLSLALNSFIDGLWGWSSICGFCLLFHCSLPVLVFALRPALCPLFSHLLWYGCLWSSEIVLIVSWHVPVQVDRNPNSLCRLVCVCVRTTFCTLCSSQTLYLSILTALFVIGFVLSFIRKFSESPRLLLIRTFFFVVMAV